MKDKSNPDKGEKAAAKAERQNARLQRQAVRDEKRAEKGKGADGTTERSAVRICVLDRVEVRKSQEGFQVYLNSSDGRRSFLVPKAEAADLLRDLDAAVQVMRAQS